MSCFQIKMVLKFVGRFVMKVHKLAFSFSPLKMAWKIKLLD